MAKYGDGTIKLITESNMQDIEWDATGNTNYETSEIRSWLNNEFLNTLDEDLVATGTFNYTKMSSSYETDETSRVKSVTLSDGQGAFIVVED